MLIPATLLFPPKGNEIEIYKSENSRETITTTTTMILPPQRDGRRKSRVHASGPSFVARILENFAF